MCNGSLRRGKDIMLMDSVAERVISHLSRDDEELKQDALRIFGCIQDAVADEDEAMPMAQLATRRLVNGARGAIPDIEGRATREGWHVEGYAMAAAAVESARILQQSGQEHGDAQGVLDELVMAGAERGPLLAGHVSAEDEAQAINNGGPAAQMAFLLAGNGWPALDMVRRDLAETKVHRPGF